MNISLRCLLLLPTLLCASRLPPVTSEEDEHAGTSLCGNRMRPGPRKPRCRVQMGSVASHPRRMLRLRCVSATMTQGSLVWMRMGVRGNRKTWFERSLAFCILVYVAVHMNNYNFISANIAVRVHRSLPPFSRYVHPISVVGSRRSLCKAPFKPWHFSLTFSSRQEQETCAARFSTSLPQVRLGARTWFRHSCTVCHPDRVFLLACVLVACLFLSFFFSFFSLFFPLPLPKPSPVNR